MKVELAGYNVDTTILKELIEKSNWKDDNVTPETLSAAYARISRDPRDIIDLRKDARTNIAKSRKSNETIIFGYGHGSVAEHAVFNIDIIELSRLAVEYVQQHRLASYTEKSQRYIKLTTDYYIPPMLDTFSAQNYCNLVMSSFNIYNSIYENLVSVFLSYNHSQQVAENKAKEDARYILPLCTYTQFGMTVNARELELMLKDFNSSNLVELQALANCILDKVYIVAPSLIKYSSSTPYSKGNPEIQQLVNQTCAKKNRVHLSDITDNVIMTDSTNTEDIELCAAILYAHTCKSYSECYNTAFLLTDDEKRELVKSVLKYRSTFESVKHYFEFIDFTFDLCISSSCYAQLKRHRLTSQIVQDYDTSLGHTLPSSYDYLEDNVKEDVFLQLETFEDASKQLPIQYQSYLLTSAHKRRVLLKLNARELYQFISLRFSQEAQWDIRNIANRIVEDVKYVAPLTTMLLCGKDAYESEYTQIYGHM